MERALEQAVLRAKAIYEQVTGHPAPEADSDAPYARIPPEVDREEHVLRQAARLYEKVVELGAPAQPGAEMSRAKDEAQESWDRGAGEGEPSIFRDGEDLRYAFDLGGAARERISVELRGATLRISSSASGQERSERVVHLPVRVEPSRVSASFTNGILTVRVRIPAIEDVPQRIEVR